MQQQAVAVHEMQCYVCFTARMIIDMQESEDGASEPYGYVGVNT